MNATRERATGQYAFSGDMSRLCRCGHTLGIHAGEAPHPCFNGDKYAEGATGEDCACERFKPANAKAGAK